MWPGKLKGGFAKSKIDSKLLKIHREKEIGYFTNLSSFEFYLLSINFLLLWATFLNYALVA